MLATSVIIWAPVNTYPFMLTLLDMWILGILSCAILVWSMYIYIDCFRSKKP